MAPSKHKPNQSAWRQLLPEMDVREVDLEEYGNEGMVTRGPIVDAELFEEEIRFQLPWAARRMASDAGNWLMVFPRGISIIAVLDWSGTPNLNADGTITFATPLGLIKLIPHRLDRLERTNVAL